WTPQAGDVDAALRKGDLKFTLDGYKLKGSWVLVRTGGRFPGARGGGGDRSWLLIKHRDDWAGELDITEFAPKSVKSSGDFEDILAADNPAIWHTNRPAKSGDAGAMLNEIIARAARIKSARATGDEDTRATGDKVAKERTKGTKGKAVRARAISKRQKTK